MSGARELVGRQGRSASADLAASQAAYHHALYRALWDWPAASTSIAASRLQGMDLLGHFGLAGCELILEAIADHAPPGPLRLAELGSGLGGGLRALLPRLRERVPVELAIGIELVEEHCQLARRIGKTAGEPPWFQVCASVEAAGLRDGCLDLVYATGSASHFADMAAVLREAHRLLRPGGLLTFTEEVSLLGAAGVPSEEFRELHPPAVFAAATWEERRGQLERAGFSAVVMRDLREWAANLLRRRLLALRVNRGEVAHVYGEAETERIAATLSVAREEIAAGRLAPAHVTARRASEERP